MITGLIGAISTVMVYTVTESEMYWLTRMTSLHHGTLLFGIILSIVFALPATLGLIAWYGGVCDMDEVTGKKLFIKLLPCFLLSTTIAFSSIFIPTTKEMCAIKAIPVIVNNNQVQELPNKVVELANEWIDELKPNKESK